MEMSRWLVCCCSCKSWHGKNDTPSHDASRPNRSAQTSTTNPNPTEGEAMIPRLKNLTPYKDRVIIKPLSAEQKTSSGIIIPERDDYQNGLQNYLCGVVISKGPGVVDNNGNLSDPPLCEIGETVFFSKAAGIPILIDSKELLMVRACDILAKAELA